MTTEQRFLEGFQEGEPGECWLWEKSATGNGYGVLWVTELRRSMGTHVVAWRLANGAWPKPGELVRHICDTPLCVNPRHLRIGSSRDNVQDMIDHGHHVNLRKTHCPQNHPYDEENTYWEGTKRHCKTCMAETTRRWNNQQRSSR